MAFKFRHILFIIFFCANSLHLSAQSDFPKYEKPYAISGGLKIGNLFQLDYKHFVTPEVALNFSTGVYLIDWDGNFLSLVLTYHHDTNMENVYWYYGGGLAARIEVFHSQIGMAGALGFEAVTRDKLINFFVDLQPTGYAKNSFFSSTTPGAFGSFSRGIDVDYTVGATVGVRYIFK